MQVDHQFLLNLRQLAVRARSADPSLHNLAYFRTPTDGELEQLRKSVTALFGEATNYTRELLDEILPTLEGTPLEDLAAIIRKEVEADLSAVRETGSEDSSTWQLGISSVQLLTKVLKAAAAVENAYCHELQLESEISHVADKSTALKIRRTYQKFWRTVDPENPATHATLLPRLRSAATSIARLTGRSIFLDMRVLDRQLLLGLQRRVLDWLATNAPVDKGMTIWRDLCALAELMHMINHRKELVEHDLALVPEMMSLLGEEAPDSHPLTHDSALLQRLEALLGRDSHLDHLLENPSSAETSEILHRLGQVEANVLSQVQLPQSV